MEQFRGNPKFSVFEVIGGNELLNELSWDYAWWQKVLRNLYRYSGLAHNEHLLR